MKKMTEQFNKLGMEMMDDGSDGEEHEDITALVLNKKTVPLIYRAVGCAQIFYDTFVDENVNMVRAKILGFDWGLTKIEKVQLQEAIQKQAAEIKKQKQKSSDLQQRQLLEQQKQMEAEKRLFEKQQLIDLKKRAMSNPVTQLNAQEASNDDSIENGMPSGNLNGQSDEMLEANEVEEVESGLSKTERLREKKEELKQKGKRLWGKLTGRDKE
eukprot:GDKJ01020278.1.p1 GENE.GDKJ01020278.1~~GDKJ01020278.1.p1  ORF type:complete len:235 (-),score=85.16 GDKJ01020278.1:83-721(-)